MERVAYGYNPPPAWAPVSGAIGNPAAYGRIPNLPPYTTDTTRQTGPDIYAQLTKNLPGYQAMVGESSMNIADQLAGRIPSDVIDLMTRQGAERGIATGAPGSPNANAAYLRALGLTSLGLMQGAEPMLTAAIQRTPIQQQQVSTQTTDLGAARAQYAAAPDPRAAALAQLAAGQQGIGAGRGGIGGFSMPSSPYTPSQIGLEAYRPSQTGLSAYELTPPGTDIFRTLAPGLTYGTPSAIPRYGNLTSLAPSSAVSSPIHQYEPEPGNPLGMGGNSYKFLDEFLEPGPDVATAGSLQTDDTGYDTWFADVMGTIA